MYDTLIPRITAMGYTVIDPWKLTDPASIAAAKQLPYGEARLHAWQKLNRTIGDNNRRALDVADKVLAVLDGPDVDSGTAAEVGYAFAKGKLIYGYRSDFRLSADDEGAITNLQVEYFVRQSGGAIAVSVNDLDNLLRLASSGVSTQTETKAIVSANVPNLKNDARDIEGVINFFERAFAIILALAFGEAFKQFVSDKTETAHIYRDRLPALLSFLFLFFPFFQGMSRYFAMTYGDPVTMPHPYAIFLMVDGFNFTIEASLFFVMSRALSPIRWREFHICVFVLLMFDSAWALFSWYFHGADITIWIKLNIFSVMILSLMLCYRRNQQLEPDDTLWPWIGCILMLARTAADYYFGWSSIYFPGA